VSKIIVTGLFVLVGLVAWFLASNLSSDALGMATGLVFGVLAGVPTALLVLASQRRRSYDDEGALDADRREQPPVIVLAAPRAEQPRAGDTHYHYHAWPFAGPPPVEWTAQQRGELVPGRQAQAQPPAQAERVFRVVGEREEWTGDDW
jgi:hypothetical protein